MKKAIVSIVKVHEVEKAVKKAINLIGGIDEYVNDNLNSNRIFIKPNLCWKAKPETGATTDPRVVNVIIDLVKRITPEISIIESNVMGGRSAYEIAKYCGYGTPEYCCFKNLSDCLTKEWNGIPMPNILFSNHVLINVPKIKVHDFVYVTCAMKNLFGLIPDHKRVKYHTHLNELIVELNRHFPSKLTVVDGLVGMEGTGSPLKGKPVEMNLIIAGNNPVSVDATVCGIIGIPPFEVPYIKMAHIMGLGDARREHIIIKGERIESVRRRFRCHIKLSKKRLIDLVNRFNITAELYDKLLKRLY